MRVALIGCGEVTLAKHLPALGRVPGTRVVAVCDIEEQKALAAAARFGVPAHSSRADDIFAMPDIDAVGVLTNPGSHADLAIRAMRAGKHIYVEKPLALGSVDCKRMVAVSASAPVIAMAGFHMRFHRLVREARELIRTGKLGRIETVRVVWHSPRADRGIAEWKTRRESGGGSLVEIAIHHFDLIRFLFETEFDEVRAMNTDGVRADEAAVMIARLQNGVLASGEFSERSPHQIEIVVSGHHGMLRVNCERFDGLEFRATGELAGAPHVRVRSARHFVKSLPVGLKTMRRGGDYLLSYENAWAHFSACVQNGQKPESTFQDGLRAAEVMEAVLESLPERASAGRL